MFREGSDCLDAAESPIPHEKPYEIDDLSISYGVWLTIVDWERVFLDGKVVPARCTSACAGEARMLADVRTTPMGSAPGYTLLGP